MTHWKAFKSGFKEGLWMGWRYEIRMVALVIVLTVLTTTWYSFLISYVIIAAARDLSEYLVEKQKRDVLRSDLASIKRDYGLIQKDLDSRKRIE